MARPRKVKCVTFEPNVTYFKPRGVPLSQLQEVELTLVELETLRLSNIEKLSQVDAAEKMHIHQSTFHRVLVRAKEKITDALVNGKAIKIKGGEYIMPNGDGTGPIGQGQTGVNRAGRMGGPLAAGPSGMCKCPKCGYEQMHARGQPCNKLKCPKCGTIMERA